MKNVFKPVLKLIVSIAVNFDIGLKEAIEKRPAIVCIKDQIDGVNGVDVARHIQMLLGAEAQTFILIHDGNSKAQKIDGLFDYIVDLNQPKDSLTEEIQNTLKAILADKWDDVFIPSGLALLPEAPHAAAYQLDEKTVPLQQPAPVAAPVAVAVAAVAEVPAEKTSPVNSSKSAESKKAVKPETPVKPVAAKKSPPAVAPPPQNKQDQSDPAASVPDQNTKPAAKTTVEPAKPAAVPVAKPAAVRRADAAPAGQAIPEASNEFRIFSETTSAQEQIPYDQAYFYEHERSETKFRRLIIIAIILLVVAGGAAWYFQVAIRKMTSPSIKKANSAAKPAPAPIPKQPLPAAQPAPPEQKPAQAVVQKPPAPPVLPTFIPLAGHDKSFAASKPGWERYIGKQAEFRVFSENGRLKAVQIIAPKESVIADSLVKAILTELTGSADFQTISQEKKSGLLVVRGTVAKKAELLFYKKELKVRAFVVTLN